MIKLKFHSVVDVITNSSTVIYTYQNSTTQAKDLVTEMLKLSGITDKSAEDIFYYGVFLSDDYEYLEDNDLPEGCPEWVSGSKDQSKWLSAEILSVMKGEKQKPQWMIDREEDNDDYEGWASSTSLCLIPKEEKYTEFGTKIKALLGSVSADGGRDG